LIQEEILRLCTTCGVEKELDEFHNYKKGPQGKAYRCKMCDTIARKAYQARQCPEKARKMRRNRQVRSKYGLEDSDYKAMVESCGNLCEICKGPPTNYQGTETLCIDHCHTTGKIRGLLCNKCNQALGLFQDSTWNLEAAISYLQIRG
jgi:hypothetical protein